jgi:acetylornithine deacetylase
MTTLDETRRILADLVAFPTISSDGNLELVAYVSDLSRRSAPAISLSLDATGTKANLFATIGEETRWRHHTVRPH